MDAVRAQLNALKLIFFVHLILVVWATQTDWLPTAYSTYNLLFLASILWSIHSRESDDALFIALFINVISVILDAIILGIWFGHNNSGFSSQLTFGLPVFQSRRAAYDDLDHRQSVPRNSSVPETSGATGPVKSGSDEPPAYSSY
ncbi:type-1 angiotensin II receptor-associated protein-like protein [Dinothrombium tinctorium]|uniref:Type-1 angiotensin II receptor-associated protein-like protein n=1 Tax=Dinothrombium tinctorium TaxID=1965070 RepID=A0A3S3Q2S1_9ACAR|nr:type-1 angiotensin II receptor-associated protein-like protein [Dinothrombium tinctorium]